MDRGQTATITAPSGLKVFISYSREDMDFVDELELVLKDKGHEVLIDRHGISAGEEFRNRLEQMIRTCDTVVFVMTDDSLTSDACGWEIDLTKNTYNKRMLVVTLKDISDGVSVPDALAGIDWIHCWRNPRVKDSNPTKGFILLDTALRTDLAWVRKESLIYDDALQWIERGSSLDSPLLLSGELLTDAQAWAREAPDGHAVSPEVDRFIKASAQADARQKAEAEANIAEREKALEDARIAIAAREAESEKARAAVAEQERANARARRRTYWAAGVSCLLIIGAALGLYFFNQMRINAIVAQEDARISLSEAAQAKRDNAISRAQVIAEAAMNQLEAGDVESATRLAILAFQEGKEADGVASANVALSLIAQEKRAVGFLSGHESPVVKYVPAAWDNLALTLTTNGAVRLWNETELVAQFPDTQDRYRDVIFNNQLQLIITLQTSGTLKAWSARQGKLLDLGQIVTPEAQQENVGRSYVFEKPTSLLSMPDGGFLAETTLGRVWVFAPDEGSFISEAFDKNTANRFRYSDSELAILSEHQDTGLASEVKYTKLFYSDGSWATVDATGQDFGSINERQWRLAPFLAESDSSSGFVWSADLNVAARLRAENVFVVDQTVPQIFNLKLRLPVEQTNIAVTPDNAHVAVWGEDTRSVALFAIQVSTEEIGGQTWKNVPFDFGNPTLVSDTHKAELRLGTDQNLRVLHSKTGSVISGPFQGVEGDVAAYTLVNDGHAALVQNRRAELFAFDAMSGKPIRAERNRDTEIRILDTGADRLAELVNSLCADLTQLDGRTALTSGDAAAVVLVQKHLGKDVCAGPLGDAVPVDGNLFGKGEIRSLSDELSRALEFALAWEGGYVDHPDDPGGRTNKGVTQKVYDDWRRENGLEVAPVLHITDLEVGQIYRDVWWLGTSCDRLPERLAVYCLDTTVNMGPRQTIKMLQTAAGQSATGSFTETDFDALNSQDEEVLVREAIRLRRQYYETIVERNPRMSKFLKGWSRRVDALETFIAEI